MKQLFATTLIAVLICPALTRAADPAAAIGKIAAEAITDKAAFNADCGAMDELNQAYRLQSGKRLPRVVSCPSHYYSKWSLRLDYLRLQVRRGMSAAEQLQLDQAALAAEDNMRDTCNQRKAHLAEESDGIFFLKEDKDLVEFSRIGRECFINEMAAMTISFLQQYGERVSVFELPADCQQYPVELVNRCYKYQHASSGFEYVKMQSNLYDLLNEVTGQPNPFSEKWNENYYAARSATGECEPETRDSFTRNYANQWNGPEQFNAFFDTRTYEDVVYSYALPQLHHILWRDRGAFGTSAEVLEQQIWLPVSEAECDVKQIREFVRRMQATPAIDEISVQSVRSQIID